MGSRLEGQGRTGVSVPQKTQVLTPFSVPSGRIDSLALHFNVSAVHPVDSTNTPLSTPSPSP